MELFGVNEKRVCIPAEEPHPLCEALRRKPDGLGGSSPSFYQTTVKEE